MQEQARPKIQEVFAAAFTKLSDIERRFAATAPESAPPGSVPTPTQANSSATGSLEEFEAAAERLLNRVGPRDYNRARDEVAAIKNALVTVASYVQGTYPLPLSYRLGVAVRRLITGESISPAANRKGERDSRGTRSGVTLTCALCGGIAQGTQFTIYTARSRGEVLSTTTSWNLTSARTVSAFKTSYRDFRESIYGACQACMASAIRRNRLTSRACAGGAIVCLALCIGSGWLSRGDPAWLIPFLLALLITAGLLARTVSEGRAVREGSSVLDAVKDIAISERIPARGRSGDQRESIVALTSDEYADIKWKGV